MKAAIYARVSTELQDYALQVSELRAYAQRMQWEPVEYLEKEGATKRRPVWEALMADAKLRKVDVVLVWKMDRWARSLRQLLDSIFELDRAGVRFIAVTQSIDTDSKNPAGRLLMQILGAVAEFERSIIVERTLAGLRVARSRGVHIGRPRRIFDRSRAETLHKCGFGIREIAKKLRVGAMTVQRALKALKPAPNGVPKPPKTASEPVLQTKGRRKPR